MKVRNIDMALFWNNVDVIRRKRLPLMLSFALNAIRMNSKRSSRHIRKHWQRPKKRAKMRKKNFSCRRSTSTFRP